MGDRSSNGRFTKGCKPGPGNPFLAKRNQYVHLFYDCVTEDDFRAVARVLIEQARAGVEWAVVEFLDRTSGKANQQVDINVDGRITLETAIQATTDEVIELARRTGTVDRLPPRLRTLALEAPPAQHEVIDVEASIVPDYVDARRAGVADQRGTE